MTTEAPFPSLTKLWHTDTYDAINPSRPELSAKGKVVLITGGGSGIGAATAKAFAAAGCTKLALVGRRQNALDNTASAIKKGYPAVKILTPTADITNESQINAAVDSVAQEFGAVDVLVANSGFLSTPATVTEGDPADWWKTFEVNVYGQMLTVRAFLKHASTAPVIISISSGVATMPALPVGNSGYVASKLGAIRLFDYLALEKRDMGLKVVQVHPGVVESEINVKSSIPPLDKGR